MLVKQQELSVILEVVMTAWRGWERSLPVGMAERDWDTPGEGEAVGQAF